MGNCLAGGATGSRSRESGLAKGRRKAKCLRWQDLPELKNYNLDSSAIGHGGYSDVYVAKDKVTGDPTAIKVVSFAGDLTVNEERLLENEARYLPLLEHPHIVKCHQVLESRHHLVMVMEHCGGGELLKRMASQCHEHSESKVCSVFAPVVRAVHYCHTLGIAHRDIKPENIMFGDAPKDGAHASQPKLLDFGLASLINPQQQVVRGVVGSPGFIAPEIINGKPHSLAMDIWSLGALLFMLLTGRHMFDRLDVRSLYYGKKSIKDAPGLKDSHFLALSPCAKDLLMWMLADEPADRPTAKQVLDHEFLHQQGAWEALSHQADTIKRRFAQIAHMRHVRGLAFAMHFEDECHEAPTQPGAAADNHDTLLHRHRNNIRRIRAKAGLQRCSVLSALNRESHRCSEFDGHSSSDDASNRGAHSHTAQPALNSPAGCEQTHSDAAVQSEPPCCSSSTNGDGSSSHSSGLSVMSRMSRPGGASASSSFKHTAAPGHHHHDDDDACIPLPPKHVDPLAVLNALPDLMRAHSLPCCDEFPGYEEYHSCDGDDGDEEQHQHGACPMSALMHGGVSPVMTPSAMRHALLPRAMSTDMLLGDVMSHCAFLQSLAVEALVPLDGVLAGGPLPSKPCVH